MMMQNKTNNWVQTSLEQLIDIKHGWAFPGSGITETPSNNVLVTPGSFKIGGGFKKDNKKFYNGDYPEEFLLSPGDLIVTMTDLSKGADTLGYSAIVPDDGRNYLHNQRIGLVKIKDDRIDKDFLYWLMRTYQYQRFIAGSASGTTVKHTSPSSIKKYSFLLPPKPEQKKIAQILFSFDDKIEVNNQINRNLEEQIQALYRFYFEGNKKRTITRGKLKDICVYVTEKTSVSELTLDNYFSTENLLTDKRGATKASGLPQTALTTKCVSGNILVSNIRPYFKKLLFCDKEGGCSTDVLCFQANTPQLTNFLYSTLYFDSFFDYMTAGSKGTKMPRGDKAQIMEYPIPIPAPDLLAEFNRQVIPMIKLCQKSKQENTILSQTRDTLLPKLMSGENII